MQKLKAWPGNASGKQSTHKLYLEAIPRNLLPRKCHAIRYYMNEPFKPNWNFQFDASSVATTAMTLRPSVNFNLAVFNWQSLVKFAKWPNFSVI